MSNTTINASAFSKVAGSTPISKEMHAEAKAKAKADSSVSMPSSKGSKKSSPIMAKTSFSEPKVKETLMQTVANMLSPLKNVDPKELSESLSKLNMHPDVLKAAGEKLKGSDKPETRYVGNFFAVIAQFLETSIQGNEQDMMGSLQQVSAQEHMLNEVNNTLAKVQQKAQDAVNKMQQSSGMKWWEKLLIGVGVAVVLVGLSFLVGPEIDALLAPIGEAISGAVGGVADAVGGALSGLADAAGDGLSSLGDSISSLFSDGGDEIGGTEMDEGDPDVDESDSQEDFQNSQGLDADGPSVEMDDTSQPEEAPAPREEISPAEVQTLLDDAEEIDTINGTGDDAAGADSDAASDAADSKATKVRRFLSKGLKMAAPMGGIAAYTLIGVNSGKNTEVEEGKLQEYQIEGTRLNNNVQTIDSNINEQEQEHVNADTQANQAASSESAQAWQSFIKVANISNSAA